jgi:hypothetical protein
MDTPRQKPGPPEKESKEDARHRQVTSGSGAGWTVTGDRARD